MGNIVVVIVVVVVEEEVLLIPHKVLSFFSFSFGSSMVIW